MVSGLAGCEAVLAAPSFGKPEGADDQAAARRGGPGVRSLLRSNPPDHTRLRRLVSRAFTPARVRDLTPGVEALTAQLARLEAGVALQALLPLLPRLRIAGEPRWRPTAVLRGLEQLLLEEAGPGSG